MLATLETDTSSWGTHGAGQDQTHRVTAHLSALALPAPPCPRRGGEAVCQRSLQGPSGSVTGGAWLWSATRTGRKRSASRLTREPGGASGLEGAPQGLL